MKTTEIITQPKYNELMDKNKNSTQTDNEIRERIYGKNSSIHESEGRIIFPQEVE